MAIGEKSYFRFLWHSPSFFAFACNAKSFAATFLFFLFLLLHSVSGRADKSVLSVFHQLAPKMPVTSTESASLDTLRSVCVRNVPLVHIRSACDS